jgi:hypothetical protein
MYLQNDEFNSIQTQESCIPCPTACLELKHLESTNTLQLS